jgi:hypothetical protein
LSIILNLFQIKRLSKIKNKMACNIVIAALPAERVFKKVCHGLRNDVLLVDMFCEPIPPLAPPSALRLLPQKMKIAGSGFISMTCCTEMSCYTFSSYPVVGIQVLQASKNKPPSYDGNSELTIFVKVCK